MNTAKELAATPLFAGLGAEGLATFAGIASEMKFEPGQTVYEAGSAGDALYVVVQGSFGVRLGDEQGEEIEVARLKPGSYFGEMEVLGGMNRTAAIVSLEDGRAYRFDAVELLALLKGDTRLAAHFYRQVALELINRLKSTTRDMGYFKARAT